MKSVIEMNRRSLFGAIGNAFGVACIFALIYLFLKSIPSWQISEGENFVLFFQVLLGSVLAGLLSAMALPKVFADWEAVKEARIKEDRKAFDVAVQRTLHPAFQIVLAVSYIYLNLGGAMLVKTPETVAIPSLLMGGTILWFIYFIIMDLAGYFDGIWYVLPFPNKKKRKS